MKQLLCFGDSNTWGLIPKTNDRYEWGTRWTSILQNKLIKHEYRVLEEGLCGRTTVYEDAYRKNRNGLESLSQILETNYPIDGVVIMLGTNDCKSFYKSNPFKIAKGIELCIDELLKYVSSDRIILVSPIFLGNEVWKDEYDPEFDTHSVEISHQLYEEYRKVALDKEVNLVNAAAYVKPSKIDQEHFTVEGHKVFAKVIYKELLNSKMVG